MRNDYFRCLGNFLNCNWTAVIKKPAKPARDTIAPSDLTFGLSTCKRCIWIKYWFKVTLPGQFPIIGTLSKLQEAQFRGANMPDLDPSLRPG